MAKEQETKTKEADIPAKLDNPYIQEYTDRGFEYLGKNQAGILHFRLHDKEENKSVGVPGYYTLKNERFFFVGYNLAPEILKNLKK